MLRAWRIVKRKHQNEAFSGEGAKLYGGRWNSPGLRVIYTAQSQSLASLEMLVNLESREMLSQYSLFEVTFEASLVADPALPLPTGWDAEPAPKITAHLGDRWIRERTSLLLRVPSAITPAEHNFLVNPTHPQFNQIELAAPTPFHINPRLLQKLK